MVTASAARTLLPERTRLDVSAARHQHSAILSHGTTATGAVWTARLLVDLSAPRPTPRLQSFTLAFDVTALREALDEDSFLLAHPHGLACARATSTELHYADLAWDVRPTGDWTLTPRSFVSIARREHAAAPTLDDRNDIADAIATQLPVFQRLERTHWRWNMAGIFAHFIDAGWHLPIIESPGFARFTAPLDHHAAADIQLPNAPWDDRTSTHDQALEGADMLLRWDSNAADIPEPPAILALPTPDRRLRHALEDVLHGAPVPAALWSASATGDATGAYLAMQLARHAAHQEEYDTLHTLRITQTRLVERGQRRAGTLAALLTVHNALQDPENTEKYASELALCIAHDLGLMQAKSWVHSAYRAWQNMAPAQPIPRPTRTPSTPKRLPSEAFAQSATPPPSKPPPLADSTLLPRALAAFEQDEDERAWALTTAALEQSAVIASEAEASMVLRLSTKFADPATHKDALRTIIRDAPSQQHVIRAAQLLAEHEDADGAFERADQMLRKTIEAYPNAVLLRVARAQLLSRNGHPNAADAWNDVLAQPKLEAWEVAQYSQERDAAIAWSAAGVSSSKATGETESTAPTVDRALDALYLLCFGAHTRDASTLHSLTHIDQALLQRPNAAQRATLLARRAALYLLQRAYDRAAQSWTGALILSPDDPKVLAGMALTRTLQATRAEAQPARQRFLVAYDASEPASPQERDALDTLYAFLS